MAEAFMLTGLIVSVVALLVIVGLLVWFAHECWRGNWPSDAPNIPPGLTGTF